MSDTPRTDAAFDDYWNGGTVGSFADFARYLERELAAAQHSYAMAEMAREVAQETIERLTREKDALRQMSKHVDHTIAVCIETARNLRAEEPYSLQKFIEDNNPQSMADVEYLQRVWYNHTDPRKW